MPEILPPELRQFVEQEVASGNYRNEQELMVDAVRLLRDSRRQQQEVREILERRVAGLDRGEGIELEDDEALRQFFLDLESEVLQERAENRGSGR